MQIETYWSQIRHFVVRYYAAISLAVLLLYWFLPMTNLQDAAAFMPLHFSVYVVFVIVSSFLLVGRRLENVYHVIAKVDPSIFISIISVFFALFSFLMLRASIEAPPVFWVPWIAWSLISPIVLIGAYLHYRQQEQNIENDRVYTIPYSVLVVALIALIVVWIFDLQFVIPNPNIRLVVGTLLAILPGMFLQQILYYKEPFSLTRALSLGFVFSVMLASLVFFVTIQLGNNIHFVSHSLLVISMLLGLILLWLYRKTSFQVTALEFDTQEAALYFGFVFAIVMMAQLVFASLVFYRDVSDYITYNAYASHFAQADAILKHEIIYGTSNPPSARFSIVLWPGFEALIATHGNYHILLAKMTTAAFVSIIALLSVYELARAINLSRKAAFLAVITQTALLVVMEGSRYTGDSIFIQSILEDKVLGAFVIAPVILRMALDYYQGTKPRNLAGYIFACLAFTFIHPTIFAFTAVIIGFFGLLRIGLNREWRKAIITVAIITISMLPLVAVRLEPILSQSDFFYSTTIDEREAKSGREIDSTFHGDRLYIIEGTPFYSINPELLDDIGFLVVYAACAFSLFHFRQSSSQLIIASCLLLLVLSIPYIAWIIGIFVTPTQLWRARWLMPLGIASAVLAVQLLPLLGRLKINQKIGLIGFITTLYVIMILVIPNKPVIKRYLLEMPEFDKTQEYSDLISITQQLKDGDEQIGVVVGDGSVLSDLLPTLGLPTLHFRNRNAGRSHANVSVELSRRWNSDWNNLQKPNLSVEEWLETVQRNNVTHALITDSERLYGRFSGDLAPYVELLFQTDEYYIYRISVEP